MKNIIFNMIVASIFCYNVIAEFIEGNVSYSLPVSSFKNCRGLVSTDFFDFSGFAKSDVADIVIDNLEIDSEIGTLYIHPCIGIDTTTDSPLANCPTGYSAYFISDADGTCTTMSPIFDDKSANYNVSEISNSTMNDKNKTLIDISGGQLIYTTSFPTLDGSNYTLVLQLACNSAKNAEDFSEYSAGTEDDYIYVQGYSGEGCPVYSGKQMYYFMERYKWIFIIVGIVFGLFVCFFGYCLWKLTLFLVAAAAAGGALFIVLFMWCLPTVPLVWLWWTYLGLSIIIGVIVGFLVMKIEKIGVCLAGGVLGFFGATFLEALIFAHLDSKTAEIVFWCVVAVMIVVGMVLAFFLHDHILILSTSFSGSFAALYGLGWMIGGFPNVFTLAEQLNNGTITSIPWTLYLYLAGILVLFILGTFVQYKIRARKLQKEREKEVSTDHYYKSQINLY